MSNVVFGNYAQQEADKNLTPVVLGLFFDGTLNNKRNTYIREQRERKAKKLTYDKVAVKEYPFGFDKDSYANDYSNVARMVDFYTLGSSKAIYVEGIGTLNGDTDTVGGYVTGTGSTGIRAKVRIGCENAAKKIPAKSKISLTLDVFGFSRGAAAARAFVNEVTKIAYKARPSEDKDGNKILIDYDGHPVSKKDLPSRGHLGYLLGNNGVEIVEFQVRFLGLYDTVSSYGVYFENDTTNKTDIADLNLKSVGHPSVLNVVQIAAGHEWRTNFNLTDISSAGKKGLELTFPGAHADVGGCYTSEVYKQSHNVKGMTSEDQNVVQRKGSASKEFKAIPEKYKKGLVDQGWYKPNQMTYISLSGDYSLNFNCSRYIDKRYSYITLHFMCELADEKNSKFKMQELKSPKNFEVPEKAANGEHILGYVKGKLKQYVDATKKMEITARKTSSYKTYLDFNNEKILINGFIHWSATGKTGHGPRPKNIRKIIPG